MGRAPEESREFYGKVEYTSAKARLVEDEMTGLKYWVPKSQTYDFTDVGDDLFLFTVSKWWHERREPVE